MGRKFGRERWPPLGAVGVNILVLTPWFPGHPNDQHGNFVLDSIESLCALGHHVHVLVTRPFVPDFPSDSKRRGCGAIKPEMSRRGFSLSCVQYLSIPRNYLRFVSNRLYLMGCAGAVKQSIVDNAIDVVHAHTESAGYLACDVAGAMGVPVVTTLHGINRGKRYLYGLGQPAFMRRALSCPDRLVLVGAPLFDFVRNYVTTLDHVRVVHNGFRAVEATPYKRRHALGSPDKVLLASVSNLVEGKGIDVNLAALGRPEIARLRHWHYHVVGDGPLRPMLEAQARKLNIADRVTFHGQRPHDEVFRLLASCDVFSLPSAPEAFGVAYLEAMACGLLGIGVESQGPSSFIEDGRTGILISERDVDGLASRLLEIFNNPSRYADMAEAGREHVWKNLSWQPHAEAMTNVFLEAVESRASILRATEKP
jgi:teichuronic acid biosynthesis glycosyltransferase TuaC